MLNQRLLSALFVFALAASTQACGQSSNSTETPPAPGTPAPATPSAAPTPAPTPAATPAAAPSETPTEPNNQTTTTKKLYCPDVSKLKKINMFWGAPGGWRSYSESFVNVIDSFVGAQWVGINVGKMLCIYKSKSTFEFPVVLQNDTLTPVPEGEKWVFKQKEGLSNCISGDILECPFKFEEESGAKDFHKELDFFKGKKDYLQDGSVKP